MIKPLRSSVLGMVCLMHLAIAGCRKDRDKAPELMEITSFIPAEGSAGDTITINGKKFADSKAENIVMINGKPVEVYQANATQLKIVVSEQVTTGKIKVKAGSDSTITVSSFTVTPALITLNSFAPDHGEWGTVVTVKGRKILSDAKIYFDNILVTEFEPGRTLNTVSFKIPAGAKSNKITIVHGEQYKQFSHKFTVTNTWEKVNVNVLGFNISHGVFYVYDGDIYFGLGANGANENRYFLRYDTSDNQWHNAFRSPGSGQHASIVEYGGKIYVGNGVLINGRNQGTWSEFDPAQPDQWNSSTEWNFGAGNNGNVTFVVNGKIYSGFGNAGSVLYRWDRTGNNPDLWKWVEPQHYTFPSLCLNFASQFVIGNDVYVGAGFNMCGSYVGTKYFKLNPETATYTEVEPFPENVTFTNAFSRNGKGYVITENGGFYEYDPVANTWTTQAGVGLSSRYATKIGDKIFAWTSDGQMAKFIPNY